MCPAASLHTPGVLYFYEILSAFYCDNWREAESVLCFCRRLWGQPYVAPVFTLLLHKWLLLHPEAGGASERLKHTNVLVEGECLADCRQVTNIVYYSTAIFMCPLFMLAGAWHLFWGDVNSGCRHFAPLFRFMMAVLILDPGHMSLTYEPIQGQEPLLSILASFMPYYSHPKVGVPRCSVYE